MMVGACLISKWLCCSINVKTFIIWVRRYEPNLKIGLPFPEIFLRRCTFMHIGIEVRYHGRIDTVVNESCLLLQVLRLQELLSKYQRADDGNTPQVPKYSSVYHFKKVGWFYSSFVISFKIFFLFLISLRKAVFLSILRPHLNGCTPFFEFLLIRSEP